MGLGLVWNVWNCVSHGTSYVLLVTTYIILTEIAASVPMYEQNVFCNYDLHKILSTNFSLILFFIRKKWIIILSKYTLGYYFPIVTFDRYMGTAIKDVHAKGGWGLPKIGQSVTGGVGQNKIWTSNLLFDFLVTLL